MKTRDVHDPRRWRRVTPEQGGLEGELGAAVRAVAEPKLPDDLRLAQIRQEIQRRHPVAGPTFRVRWAALHWAAVVVAMLLGSGVTAVAGWALVLRNRPAPAIAPRVESVAPAAARPRSIRRWRVRAGAPAVLDLTVDDGAALTVAEGGADLFPSESAAPVHLARGDVWHAGDAARPAAPIAAPLQPAAVASSPISASAPMATPAPVEPAHRSRTADWTRSPRLARPAPAGVAVAPEAPPSPSATETTPPPLPPTTKAATVAEALHAARQRRRARRARGACALRTRFPVGDPATGSGARAGRGAADASPPDRGAGRARSAGAGDRPR